MEEYPEFHGDTPLDYIESNGKKCLDCNCKKQEEKECVCNGDKSKCVCDNDSL